MPETSDMPLRDVDLVMAAKTDPAAMDLIFRRSERAIWKAVHLTLGPDGSGFWNMLRSCGVEPQDAYQVAAIGLLRAIRDFDPQCGASPLTYAMHCMKSALRNWMRGQGHHGLHLSRREVIEVGRDVTVESLDSDVDPDQDGRMGSRYELIPDPSAEFEAALALRDAIERSFGRMTERRREGVRMVLGGRKQTEAAATVGLCQSQISRALTDLRRWIREAMAV